MDLFEYQGKQLFARYDIPVSATPPGETGMPKRAKYCLPWYSKRST